MAGSAEVRAERAERLRRVGIPPAAAKAYVALVELGETEAREVARLSGIPFAKVYAALDELHVRGLADIMLDNPRRYSPRPVDEYLVALRESREEELRHLERERAAFADMLPVGPGPSLDDRGAFLMVRGRRGTLRRVEQLLAGAHREVYLLAPRELPFASLGGWRRVHELLSRGVAVRVLAARAWEAGDARDGTHGLEVRRFDDDEPGRACAAMVLVDREQAFIVQLASADEVNVAQAHDVGMFTTQPGFVGVMHDLMRARWDGARSGLPGA